MNSRAHVFSVDIACIAAAIPSGIASIVAFKFYDDLLGLAALLISIGLIQIQFRHSLGWKIGLLFSIAGNIMLYFCPDHWLITQLIGVTLMGLVYGYSLALAVHLLKLNI